MPSKPLNAFSPEYLAALRKKDEPVTAADADVTGPWTLREHESKFYIFREWESFETGHAPQAEFTTREEGLLFVTALRAIAADPVLHVREPAAPGAPACEVEQAGRVMARLAYRREEWLVAAQVLMFLARSPADLALLFEVAGSQMQEMAGEILALEVLGEDGPQPGA